MNAKFRFALAAAVTASSCGFALSAHAACPAGHVLVPPYGCVNGPQLKDLRIEDRTEGQFDVSDGPARSARRLSEASSRSSLKVQAIVLRDGQKVEMQ
jgi:hypothetical protein